MQTHTDTDCLYVVVVAVDVCNLWIYAVV